jgi:hypothetical protein
MKYTCSCESRIFQSRYHIIQQEYNDGYNPLSEVFRIEAYPSTMICKCNLAIRHKQCSNESLLTAVHKVQYYSTISGYIMKVLFNKKRKKIS